MGFFSRFLCAAASMWIPQHGSFKDSFEEWGGGGGFLPNVPADPHGNSFRIFSCDSVKTLRGSSPQGSTLAAPNLSVRNRISKKVAWTHSTNPQLEILRDPHRIPLRRSSTIDHDLTGILRPDAD